MSTTEITLVFLGCFIGVGMCLSLATIAFLIWVAKGESDVNGDPERDGGEE